jgi:predicted DCC family thiol-disulfide oxidoreductase YuxK
VDNVVIFDGVCNLCTHSVQFILRHETYPVFQFSPVQSPYGALRMRELGLDPHDARTFVVIANGVVHTKSDAAIVLSRHFRAPWRWLGAVRIIPRPVRDWVYDLFARNRYQWFGRTSECMVPTSQIRTRFIEDQAQCSD